MQSEEQLIVVKLITSVISMEKNLENIQTLITILLQNVFDNKKQQDTHHI